MMLLEGVRVLDLSRVLAGPFATQVLGDMGAEVLKIESPSGDDTRGWGPPFQAGMSAYFQCCNRNKSSLTLNLKDPADHQRLLRLADRADVIIDNFTGPVRARLGLEPERFKRAAAQPVIMNIRGYRGQRADEPGYDLLIQAESGLMAITGPEDGPPYKVGVALVDVLTGMMAANGILAALFRRERSGKGAVLSVSLFQTALFSMINVCANVLVTGRPSRRWGNAHPNIVPYQAYACADRSIIIAVGTDAQYGRLCRTLAIDDPDLIAWRNVERVGHREQLNRVLGEAIRAWPSQKLLAALKKEGVPSGPILRPDEALAKAGAWDPSAILTVEHRALGAMRLVGNPLTGNGIRTDHQPPPQRDEGGQAMADRWLAARSGT